MTLRSLKEKLPFPKRTTTGSNPVGETIKCPKGYKLIIEKTYAAAAAYRSKILSKNRVKTIRINIINIKKNDAVGWVDLVWTQKRFWETHSYVDEDERGKGLGLAAYSKAINVVLRRVERVMSSSSPSADAVRVWQ